MAQFNVDSEVIAAKSAQARSYVASITQINEALTRAGVNYADTEQANASMFVS